MVVFLIQRELGRRQDLLPYQEHMETHLDTYFGPLNLHLDRHVIVYIKVIGHNPYERWTLIRPVYESKMGPKTGT
jgi:hypothetical protein